MSKIREKVSLECGRMHVQALKTQKLAADRLAHFTMLAIFGLKSWGLPP